MLRPLVLAFAVLLPLLTGGCLGGQDGESESNGEWPPGWREEIPARSQLASEPTYELKHSTSFVLKGHSYGRYVVHVPEAIEDAQVFFTTGNHDDLPGLRPSIDDPDNYHFEFLQIRPYGREVSHADVDATNHFSHAPAKGVYTLTYLYGKGADYQMLAPYEGRADSWRLEPGYYDFVLATDEKLTVAINIRTGSPYWSTYYHPHELGTGHAEALAVWGDTRNHVGGKLPDDARELRATVDAEAGQLLNYFTFADVWYETDGAALGTRGTSTVVVDGDPVPHRLEVNTPRPEQAEAYAFAMDFNRPGPVTVDLRAQLEFHEEASARSKLILMLFMLGVVLTPEETAADLPPVADSAPLA